MARPECLDVDAIALGWAGLGFALLLLALVTAVKARQWWQETHLPAGNILYTDAGAWYPLEEPLFDDRLGLVGRPDYLIEQTDGRIIPVEVKSGASPPRPHPGHVLQLASYCLLVTSAFGQRPDHGILQYRNRAFAVTFTEEMEEDLLDILAEMRADLFEDDVPRDHEQWSRCAGCGHRPHCEDSLA